MHSGRSLLWLSGKWETFSQTSVIFIVVFLVSCCTTQLTFLIQGFTFSLRATKRFLKGSGIIPYEQIHMPILEYLAGLVNTTRYSGLIWLSGCTRQVTVSPAESCGIFQVDRLSGESPSGHRHCHCFSVAACLSLPYSQLSTWMVAAPLSATQRRSQ